MSVPGTLTLGVAPYKMLYEKARMSGVATSGNVAVALTDSNGCGRQWIPKKVCAKITHNRDLVAH